MYPHLRFGEIGVSKKLRVGRGRFLPFDTYICKRSTGLLELLRKRKIPSVMRVNVASLSCTDEAFTRSKQPESWAYKDCYYPECCGSKLSTAPTTNTHL